MTSKALVRVDAETLLRIAFNSGHEVEIDAANHRAFLTVGPTTFVTETEATA